MPRIMLVANQTLGGQHLLDVLQERAKAGDVQVHVVVPASTDPRSASSSEELEQEQAQERLASALKRFADAGVTADGEIGDSRPIEAIGDVLRREEFDEIILSTLPPRASKWLRMDLPHRVERAFPGRVTHVVADPEA